MENIIGIDLGTTMSAMAYIDDVGKSTIIPNSEGSNLTPSAVLIRGNERVIGRKAKNSSVSKANDVFMFFKRELSTEGYKFKDSKNDEYTPDELSALILRKLKDDAELHLNKKITNAVITVPAYFADLDRRLTKQAGEIAGFKVLDILNEPTAAAIAYGIEKIEGNKNILVYDLGGGTFDVTILKIDSSQNFTVLATDGNRFLGGHDFDEIICKYFANMFEEEHGINPLNNNRTYQDFLEKAEAAKIDLSSDTESSICLTAEGKILDIDLQREKFEELIYQKIQYTIKTTNSVLKSSEISDWNAIDKILLVGGSTRIPLIHNMLSETTGIKPEVLINPDEVVAKGAAIYAAGLVGKEVRGKEGEAISDLQVVNVTAHSLGIVAVCSDKDRDINSIIINKQSPIPSEQTKSYQTTQDNQTQIAITVLQGEHENPEYCMKLSPKPIYLTNLPAKPKGEVKVNVTLGYDGSGIVKIHAVEQTTGQEIKAEIGNNAILSEEALEAAVKKVSEVKLI